mgnify:CR=1 FL=1
MSDYLLVTGDFVRTGGMDRANFALADYLARQGDAVHLVAYRVAPELLAYPNVRFHRVPKLLKSYLLSDPLLSRVGEWKAERIRLTGGRSIVNGGNCLVGDVNWVHYVHAAYQPEIVGSQLQHWKQHLTHQIALNKERKALQRARLIIVNSERTKKDLIEKLAVPEQKIHRVYLGIDPTTFYPATFQEKLQLRQQFGWSADRPVVMFIGALGDRRKGFDTLFAAWKRLCADPDWDADLVVVGRGAELSQWQQRVIEAGLSKRIRFLGFRSDVPDLLRAADCLVAPTRYEAYGLGVHEALCCGLTALVTATAGVAERYPDNLHTLLLPNSEDGGLLSAKLQEWRGNVQDYYLKMVKVAQDLRSYTWDDMATAILHKIESI